jgi:putative phosphoesterase
MKIGVVSDTHGLLRPEVVAALAGVERILHLGDVGDAEILRELEKIAPVTAVRGNIDREGECVQLPETEVVEVQGFLSIFCITLKNLILIQRRRGLRRCCMGTRTGRKYEDIRACCISIRDRAGLGGSGCR